MLQNSILIVVLISVLVLVNLVQALVYYRSGLFNRKQYKKLYDESNNLNRMFRDVLNTIPARVFWKDLNSTYLGANKLFAEDAGFSEPEDLVGKDDFALFPNDAKLYRSDDREVMKSGLAKINYEEPQMREDGNNWLVTTKIPLKDHEGNIYGVLGTYADVTSVKHQELELKNTQDLLLMAQRMARMGNWLVDRSNMKAEWSRELFDIYGFERKGGSPGLKKWNDTFHEDDRDMAMNHFNRALEQERPLDLIHRIRRADNGQVRWLHVKGEFNKDKEGRSFLAGMSQDITELKEIQTELENHQANLELLVRERTDELMASNLELQATNEEISRKSEMILEQKEALELALAELKETQVRLLQAEKMASLGTLTAGVAHEINNPLNYLSGAHSGLVHYFNEFGSREEEKTSFYLKSIREGIDRTSGIVKGLNQFSRDNSRLDEDCDLHAILDNCLLMLYNQIKQKAVVEKAYTKENLSIKGNVGKMHQVFINILTNAVQSIENEGLIRIITKKQKDRISIDISDNGCGIPAEHLKQITDPFFTTKDPGEGTGLGLSITYNILQDHGGGIEFISNPGEGTQVMVNLPLK